MKGIKGWKAIKLKINSYQKYIIIGMLGIILCIGTQVMSFNYHLEKMFNQALTYYHENDLISFDEIRYELYHKRGEEFDTFLTQEALGTFEKFKNNEISYYEAMGIAKRIEAFSNQSSSIQTYQQQIEDLQQSRNAFEKAEELAIDKQWEEAYNYYQQVIEFDPNYEKAQELAESAKRWWLQEILVQAVTFYEEGAYEKSLEMIEQGLELSSDDEAFLNLKESVHLARTEGEKENKWTEFKDKINSSIQSGIENFQNIFNKLFGG